VDKALNCGIAAVELDGKWRYAGKTGNVAIFFIDDEARIFLKGLVKVKLNGEELQFDTADSDIQQAIVAAEKTRHSSRTALTVFRAARTVFRTALTVFRMALTVFRAMLTVFRATLTVFRATLTVFRARLTVFRETHTV
jgi:hypothetical protein